MRFMVNLMVFILFAMPVGAAFVLIKRLKQGRTDNGAKEKLLEALYAENIRKKSETNTSDESIESSDSVKSESEKQIQETAAAADEAASEPETDENIPLTEEEKEIAMAKKRAAEMLASVKKTADLPRASVSADSAASGNGTEGKLTKEEALDIVSRIIGSSKNDGKNKGLTAAEIHAMIEKRASEKK